MLSAAVVISTLNVVVFFNFLLLFSFYCGEGVGSRVERGV